MLLFLCSLAQDLKTFIFESGVLMLQMERLGIAFFFMMRGYLRMTF